MISVIGIGALYTFVSWMAIAGTGAAESVRLAQNPATGSEIFFTPTRVLLGDWAVIVFKILLISGSFACAWHSTTALPGTALPWAEKNYSQSLAARLAVPTRYMGRHTLLRLSRHCLPAHWSSFFG